MRLEAGALRRVLAEEVEGPGQRIAGGLVTGEKEGHQVVADLDVAELGAGLGVFGVEEALQQILLALAAFAAAGRDHPRDEGVEGGDRALLPPARDVQPAGDRELGPDHAVLEGPHGVADGVDIGARVVAEERPGDDAQGQLHHRVGEIEALPFSPGLRLADGLIDHHLGVFGHPLGRERRLDDAPVLSPELTVGGEQTGLAEHLTELAEGAVGLAELLRLGDQHRPDVLGLAEDIEARLAGGRHEVRVAVGVEAVTDEAEGVEVEVQPVANAAEDAAPTGRRAGRHAGRAGLRWLTALDLADCFQGSLRSSSSHDSA